MIDLVITALLGGALIASHYVHHAAIGAVIALVGFGWTTTVWYRRHPEIARPDRRLANAALVGFLAFPIGFTAAYLPVISASLAAVVLAYTGMRARKRVSGLPLPVEGDSSDRVIFDGTVYGTSAPVALPGFQRPVLLWVARQGKRRWASAPRIELRNEHRSVRVDPADLEINGPPSITLTHGAMHQRVVTELDGADPARRVQLWSVPPDGWTYVVTGHARREPDPDGEAVRDPRPLVVFHGDVALTHAHPRLVERPARRRIIYSVALAAGAIASLIVHATT